MNYYHIFLLKYNVRVNNDDSGPSINFVYPHKRGFVVLSKSITMPEPCVFRIGKRHYESSEIQHKDITLIHKSASVSA